MLESKIESECILTELIILSNLVKGEIKEILKEISINHVEFCILTHILQCETTQYKISKKFNISIQRVHHIINNLEKKNYIISTEGIDNGRSFKSLATTSDIETKIYEINYRIVQKFKAQKLQYKNLYDFNNLLNLFLDRISD